MSDLISRKQAVDALNNMYQAAEKWRKRAKSDVAKARAETCMSTVSEIKMRIWKLPSAQPETIRCKDCDWWTKQEDSLQGRCALLQMYPTGGWFCGNARRREVTT